MWHNKARYLLKMEAAKLLGIWLKTANGNRWRKAQYSKRGANSPYKYGFTLPDHHHQLIECLNRNDEEGAKALMLTHYLEQDAYDSACL